MSKPFFERGQEVTVIGPTVFGQFLRQGENGIVSGFYFGGVSVRMNRDDKEFCFMKTSLRKRVMQPTEKGLSQ